MSNARKPEVVVGIDGTNDSHLALEWAVDPAKPFDTVRAVTAYSVGPMFDGFGYATGAYNPEIFREAAEERSKKIISAVAPDLLDTHAVAAGYAGRVLADAANGADLLVVGCRGRGSLTQALLGSVGSYCVKHAKSPVAIVPEGVKTTGALNRLVVGIDGSANSKRALRWALDHVAQDGTVLAVGTCVHVVHAFNVEGPSESEMLRENNEMVHGVVAEVATPEEAEQVVEVVSLLGDPRLELRRVAEGADGLVMGTRGHRGVAYLLLGSVTTALTHQPTLVTIVVPDLED